MKLLRKAPSLRVRLMVLSVVSTGLILALGGTALLEVLKGNLIQAVDDAALDSAQTLSIQARRGTLPREIMATEEITTTAQVVQGDQVVSSTSRALNDPPVAHMPQPEGRVHMFGLRHLPHHPEDGPFRVAALGVRTPTGPATIYVAVDADDAYEVTAFAAKIGAVGAAVILSVLALLLWVLIGSTLAPVTLIRRRADEISGQGLHQRVPVPTTDDEIAALAETINSMLGRIESSVQRQEAFVADAAHELRTPLATLRTRLDVALMQQSEPDPELLRNLLTEVVRMAELVDHLLLLARSDTALLSTRFEPVDLDDLVVRAASTFAHPPIELTRTAVTPVQVFGNLALLEQILPNLFANAARYAKTQIDVAVTAVGDSAVITVDDDGVGIPEADRARVFDRFIRLDQSRGRQTGGTGLGLAIVDQIVRMHGGHVTAEASPLGGTRIRINLPIRQSPDSE